MKEYERPVVLLNADLAEGVYTASGVSCLSVSSWLDGTDGSGIYRVVFKVEHTGHQSYGQTVTAVMSTNVSIAEAPEDVTAEASGNIVTLVRNNQLNDAGLTEIWVKLSAAVQPTVVEATATDCVH